jgi:hypothetical protein
MKLFFYEVISTEHMKCEIKKPYHWMMASDTAS